jgi:ABC-2 type transport system permease protein/ribosome-dependent ATPase
MNARRIRAVMAKEWRETVRDRIFLLLAFLLPVLWLVVFGYGLVIDVEQIRVVAVDRDRSALSRDYLSRFMESRYFDFVGYLDSERDVDELLRTAKIRAAVIIPDRFAERLLAGEPAAVQTLLDGTFPLYTDIAKGYIVAINTAFTGDLLAERLSRVYGMTREQADRAARPVRLEVRYLYNEEVRGTWSQVPALIMFSLMLASPLLTALGVVREKESGSIYNIYSSTVSRGEFLTGKLTTYLLIAMANVLMLWAIAVWLFDVPFKGSLLLFAVASALFAMVSTGIGLVISLLVQTQMAALVITIVVSTVPTFIFSGLMVPISSMSPGGQFQAHLFPSMYYTNILRGSFLKGVGWNVLWTDVLALGVFAVVLRVWGYWLFTKRPRL